MFKILNEKGTETHQGRLTVATLKGRQDHQQKTGKWEQIAKEAQLNTIMTKLNTRSNDQSKKTVKLNMETKKTKHSIGKSRMITTRQRTKTQMKRCYNNNNSS